MDRILTQLADSVTSASTLEALTRPLLDLLQAVTGLESTYLTAIDLNEGLQRIVYARNSKELEIPEGLAVPWDDTLCKRAMDEGRLCTSDVANIWGDSEAARALGINTYVTTPVTMSDGSLYGTLCAASAARTPIAGEAERVLRMFGTLIAQYIERDRLIGQLRDMNVQLAASALTDALTALPNRRAFLSEGHRMLSQAARDGSGVVVAFVDLDGFKAVNDRLGHDAGDELLVEVGRRISSSRRAGDLSARFGGDEFVVLAPVSADRLDVAPELVRESLEACTRGIYKLQGHAIEFTGASVGVAAANGSDASLEQLVNRADDDMYRHKRKRRAVGTA